MRRSSARWIHFVQGSFMLATANSVPSSTQPSEVTMQSTLRSKITAAALLLVPLGALVAATPASADLVHAPFPGEVLIQSNGHKQDARDVRDSHDTRDHRAPAIFDVTPSQGARLEDHGVTRISARFNDDRSGIDPRAVTLRVDGRDVTGRARVEGNDIRYAEDLRPGRHFVEVQVRDRAGNLARQAWNFDVADRGWDHGDRGDRGWDHGHDGDRAWDHDRDHGHEGDRGWDHDGRR
jgi:hypothetical protein